MRVIKNWQALLTPVGLVLGTFLGAATSDHNWSLAARLSSLECIIVLLVYITAERIG